MYNMRKTTQKRTKRRRSTSKRIRRNKVIYGGAPQQIYNNTDFDNVSEKGRFQLVRDSKVIVDATTKSEFQEDIKIILPDGLFLKNGLISPIYELYVM